MNLSKIKKEMTWANWMNLVFMLILVPTLLFWTVQSFGIQRKLSEINARRIENCTVFDCEVDMFGSIECVEKRIGGPAIIDKAGNQSSISNLTK